MAEYYLKQNKRLILTILPNYFSLFSVVRHVNPFFKIKVFNFVNENCGSHTAVTKIRGTFSWKGY